MLVRPSWAVNYARRERDCGRLSRGEWSGAEVEEEMGARAGMGGSSRFGLFCSPSVGVVGLVAPRVRADLAGRG